MACERNRIIELKEYLNSLGIDLNIGKNKARGHKGFFMSKLDNFRIDISKNLDSNDTLSVMLHEFAHFVHFQHDKTLKNLDFVFGELSDEVMEELINITVKYVPKEFAKKLYGLKEELNDDIKSYSKIIKSKYPDFKLSEKCKNIEKNFSNPLKYLLKYDRVKYFNQIYSIDNAQSQFNLSEIEAGYLNLKSKQRCLKRINSRISRLNNYYNNPSELFARFIELYYTDKQTAEKIAPSACNKFRESKIEYFDKLNQICLN